MDSVLTAAGIMAGLGFVLAAGLALAHRFLHVEEDPRLDEVENRLPGSNCGACGEPGCRAFAEKLIAGESSPSGCTVSSPEGTLDIASFLGVDPGQATKIVARLRCGGGKAQSQLLAEYVGYSNCRGAHLVGSGGKGCSWGCLGLADCEVSCDFGAIAMNGNGLPVVDIGLCTACGDCVDACPRDLFVLEPVSHALVVQCAAPLEGEAARAVCLAACDACGKCALDAASGLIEMRDGLPHVDYSAGGPATPEATFRCPTGAIRWVPSGQFEEERDRKVLAEMSQSFPVEGSEGSFHV